jgi:hypothetical protein
MDTIEKEIKQGAIADLLQQKLSASSDEERLTEGISTIGIQTKRISGAQRKNHLPDPEGREGREETPEG